SFTIADGNTVNYIAQWNGTNWQALGSGMNGTVYALAVYNGNLVAGGNFTTPAQRVAQWTGANWQALGNGLNGGINALTVYNGNLVAGAGSLSSNVSQWASATWQPMGSGMDGYVLALTLYNGSLVSGGWFAAADGNTVNHIARWDG